MFLRCSITLYQKTLFNRLNSFRLQYLPGTKTDFRQPLRNYLPIKGGETSFIWNFFRPTCFQSYSPVSLSQCVVTWNSLKYSMSDLKSVLVVSPKPTHPAVAGNRQCILSYSTMLRKNGFDVFLLWVADSAVSDIEYKETGLFWKDHLFIYKKNIFHRLSEAAIRHVYFQVTGYWPLDGAFPWGIERVVKQIGLKHSFDFVIVNYVFLSRIFRYFKNCRKLLYTHDVFTNKFQRTGLKWFSLRPDAEQAALNRADSVLSIQKNESAFFRYLTKKKVCTSYNYFELCTTPYVDNKKILFLAGDNTHNIDSILWYVKNVHRELIKVDPAFHLVIAGHICSKLPVLHDEENVSMLGTINDKKQFYTTGNIVINPTFEGTGLKIKSFEALAYGKVLISHSHGTEGVYQCDYDPFIIADNPNEYIDTITSLNREKIIAYKQQSVNYVVSLNREVERIFNEALFH